MGCDIHMVLEKRWNNKWVGMHTFPYVEGATDKEGPRFRGWSVRGRNYNLFAELAGVRGSSSQGLLPIGIPGDASELTIMEVEGWGVDGHSHSWMPLEEALPIFAACCIPEQLLSERRAYLSSDLFGVESQEVQDYRLVFWFDN